MLQPIITNDDTAVTNIAILKLSVLSVDIHISQN